MSDDIDGLLECAEAWPSHTPAAERLKLSPGELIAALAAALRVTRDAALRLATDSDFVNRRSNQLEDALGMAQANLMEALKAIVSAAWFDDPIKGIDFALGVQHRLRPDLDRSSLKPGNDAECICPPSTKPITLHANDCPLSHLVRPGKSGSLSATETAGPASPEEK